MLVREAKLLYGSQEQYQALDEAIRTAQFIRNKCVGYWMDNQGVKKPALYTLSKDLAKEFEFAKRLNSSARQASAERAWAGIANFYRLYPKFQKYDRSVEYKQSGWKLSSNCKQITFTDGFHAGTFSIFCNGETQEDWHRLKILRVRVIRRADGYYAQFVVNAERKEQVGYTGKIIGLDLGLKYFYKDQNDNAVVYPQAEKRLKQHQRRLSRKYKRGGKHKQRQRLGKVHRQRKDWAIKQARCVVASNDVVVYENLQIANMARNHHLAKSIADAGWNQFTQWLDYYGKVWGKVVVAVDPAYTSQDCPKCGHRVKKTEHKDAFLSLLWV